MKILPLLAAGLGLASCAAPARAADPFVQLDPVDPAQSKAFYRLAIVP